MFICQPCCDEIRSNVWNTLLNESYGACEKCWDRTTCKEVSDSQYEYWEQMDKNSPPTEASSTTEDSPPLILDSTIFAPIIHLPTEETDVFQHIEIGADQEFTMRIDQRPGWLIHVVVKNRRTHIVDLYEEFIIGAGRMGCQDIEKRGDNPLDDTLTYVMNDGANDREGSCELEVWAELDMK